MRVEVLMQTCPPRLPPHFTWIEMILALLEGLS